MQPPDDLAGSDGETDEAPPLSVPPLSHAQPFAHRLTGRRRSSLPPPAEPEFLTPVAELLLAAASADGEICRRERRAIERILTRLCESEEVPPWLQRHIDAFDVTRFELAAAADRLRGLAPEQRRHVLELVREVCDANNAFDLEEERYLLGLVFALSLEHDHVRDLVIHSARGIDGVAKRCFDLAFSGAFLLCFWPLLLCIALAVKVTSRGPALFRQTRYGRDGRSIQVLKFRTMTVAENGDVVRQATRGDARITRLGAFLRRTSLDELPQFINVFRGEMSVVGPRPHAVAHNVQYRTQILEYMLRHKVKPGITGWAQVNGWRGETETLDKMIGRVRYDLEYIRRYSFAFDVKIVFLTLFGRKTSANAF